MHSSVDDDCRRVAGDSVTASLIVMSRASRYPCVPVPSRNAIDRRRRTGKIEDQDKLGRQLGGGFTEPPARPRSTDVAQHRSHSAWVVYSSHSLRRPGSPTPGLSFPEMFRPPPGNGCFSAHPGTALCRFTCGRLGHACRLGRGGAESLAPAHRERVVDAPLPCCRSVIPEIASWELAA